MNIDQAPAVDQPHERFVALIKPTRQPRKTKPGEKPREPRIVENDEFVLMLWRQIRALEARAIDDPELLIQVVALTQRLSEVANVTIATNAARFAVDPHKGASMAECGRILGISKQSASDRRKLGDAVIAARLDAAGGARFSEAQRERAAVDAAAEHANVVMVDFRARRVA